MTLFFVTFVISSKRSCGTYLCDKTTTPVDGVNVYWVSSMIFLAIYYAPSKMSAALNG